MQAPVVFMSKYKDSMNFVNNLILLDHTLLDTEQEYTNT